MARQPQPPPGADADETNDLNFRSWERHLRTLRRSDLTIRSYRQAVNDLRAHHRHRDLTELTKADIEDYLLGALDRLSPTTVGIRFRSLKAFYNYLLGEEVIPASPMRRLKEPAVTDQPPPIIEDVDLIALLRACGGQTFVDRRDTAIIRLFCEPGSPRVAEMASVGTDDLDLRSDKVRVHGKGDKIRVIPFGAKTGQALDRYVRLRRKHRLAHFPVLWLGGRGGPLTTSGITQMLARRAAQAGIGHVHPHQLRHTAAHVWADNDGSESDAMELFGWSSPEMPRRYGRSARTARAHRAAKRKSLGDRL